MKTDTSRVNVPLHGMRGLLATLVVAFHVYQMGWKKGLCIRIPWDFLDSFGPYCVCLFFCVSGFLITQSLARGATIGTFLRNRTLRIYPVFLILHIVMFTVGPIVGYRWMIDLRFHPLAWASAFLSNLVFLPGVFDLPIAQQNAWSLSYEAAFYAVGAGLYKAKSGQGIPRLAGYAVWLGLSASLLWHHPYFVFFLVGVCALWVRENVRIAPFRGVGFLGIPAFLVGLVLFPRSLTTAVVCSSAFFVIAVNGWGFTAKALSSQPLQRLGTISYSLYLVHPFVLGPVRTLATRLRGAVDARTCFLMFATVGPILAIAASSVVNQLIEQRMTNWLKRYLTHRRPLRHAAGNRDALTGNVLP